MDKSLWYWIRIWIAGKIVFFIFGCVGIMYTIIKHIVEGDYDVRKQLIPILRADVLSADGKCNAMAGEMLNDTLLRCKKYKYGKWYETISNITGQNFLKRCFNKSGRSARRLLDKVLGKNHCKNSIIICKKPKKFDKI